MKTKGEKNKGKYIISPLVCAKILKDPSLLFFPTFNLLVFRELKIGPSVSGTAHCSNFYPTDSTFVHVGLDSSQ